MDGIGDQNESDLLDADTLDAITTSPHAPSAPAAPRVAQHRGTNQDHWPFIEGKPDEASITKHCVAPRARLNINSRTLRVRSRIRSFVDPLRTVAGDISADLQHALNATMLKAGNLVAVAAQRLRSARSGKGASWL